MLEDMDSNSTQGSLIVVGTPIGNLGDATERLREVLESADIIAAEDTRVTKKLLSRLEISTRARLESFHEYNEGQKLEEIIDYLQAGMVVALVSDAGMPTISDPGYQLVAAAHDHNVPVTIVPGSSSVINALALAGLPTGRFSFEGFMGRKDKERQGQLEALVDEPRTMVFFDSPHRLEDSLKVMQRYFGPDRQVAVVREMTKLYEQVVRGRLEEVGRWAAEGPIKGEIVLVVSGKPKDAQDALVRSEELVIVTEVNQLVSGRTRVKDAVALVAGKHGVSKNKLYTLVVEAKNS